MEFTHLYHSCYNDVDVLAVPYKFKIYLYVCKFIDFKQLYSALKKDDSVQVWIMDTRLNDELNALMERNYPNPQIKNEEINMLIRKYCQVIAESPMSNDTKQLLIMNSGIIDITARI